MGQFDFEIGDIVVERGKSNPRYYKSEFIVREFIDSSNMIIRRLPEGDDFNINPNSVVKVRGFRNTLKKRKSSGFKIIVGGKEIKRK